MEGFYIIKEGCGVPPADAVKPPSPAVHDGAIGRSIAALLIKQVDKDAKSGSSEVSRPAQASPTRVPPVVCPGSADASLAAPPARQKSHLAADVRPYVNRKLVKQARIAASQQRSIAASQSG